MNDKDYDLLFKVREIYNRSWEKTNNIYLIMTSIVYIVHGTIKLSSGEHYVVGGIGVGEPISWFGVVLSVSWWLSLRLEKREKNIRVTDEIERRILEGANLREVSGIELSIYDSKGKRDGGLQKEWVPILFFILYIVTIPLSSPDHSKYGPPKEYDSSKYGPPSPYC